MSSGQKKEVINTNERAVSTDIDRLQDFIAQERNDIIRCLMQRSYSEFDQPGVSVVPSGAVGTPLQATVIDGLEMIVDSAGSVLITPGALVAWTGTPAGPDDTGFTVVVDAGIDSINQLVIATNSGGSPRCDVIECQVQSVTIEGNVSRDIRDPGTGLFAPQNVTKVIGSKLVYQVRQGTPGVAPGYSAGWLPLGLAIVQDGAALSQVDFYDVRPLYREWDHTSSDWNAESIAGTPADRHADSNVICNLFGPAAIASSVFAGYVDVSHNGVRFRGNLLRNSPTSQANIATFGSATQYTGGDCTGIILSAENCVRGAALSVVANDVVALVACIPNLGGSRPLPRCVRYSQANVTNPTLPGRRVPHGTNGILLALSNSQDVIGGTGVCANLTLNATGIAGVLGTAYGIIVALAQASTDGTQLLTQITAAGTGMGVENGTPAPSNRIVVASTLYHSGGVNDSSTALAPHFVANSNTVINVRAGDILEWSIGPFYLSQNTNANVGAGLQMLIEEDLGGSNSPQTGQTIVLIDDKGHMPSRTWVYPITKSGLLSLTLWTISDGTHQVNTSSVIDDWGSYKLIRP